MPDSLGLGLEVDSGSHTLDLATLPLGVALLREAGLAFQNARISNQFEEELARLLDTVRAAVQNERVGYLVEVLLYQREGGAVVIPGGQLLQTIGPGTEPLDALAEDMRSPRFRIQPPEDKALQDVSFYVWVRKAGDKFSAKTVPAGFRTQFETLANEEKERRNRIELWRVLPGTPYEQIERVSYWADVERTHKLALKANQDRDKVAELRSQMTELEQQFNGLYKRYQQVERDIQEQQSLASALHTIAVITSVVSSGIKAGALICGPNSVPASGNELKPTVDVPGTIELTTRKIISSGDDLVSIEKRLRIHFGGIMDLDKELDSLYKGNGVPIPQKEMPAFPIR